jgi:hypothetical protein
MATVAPTNALQPRIPEPTTLYMLVVVAFYTHVLYRNTETCLQCLTAWPCEQVRLAFRLREGF